MIYIGPGDVLYEDVETLRLGQLHKHDKRFMDLALEVAKASKCSRAKYGSVLVASDGRVVGTAYNGKPANSKCDNICFREGLPPNSPKENCCAHSEANVLMFTNPLERRGGTLYVSGLPCKDCSLLILQSGIKRVVYLDSPNVHTGHVGSCTSEYLDRYGIDIEWVPYKEEEWSKIFHSGECSAER